MDDEAEKPQDLAADPDDARLMVGLVIGGLLVLVGSILYLVAGEHWWRLLIVLVVVPLLYRSVAGARHRYMRSVAQRAGLDFRIGFPALPPGSPGHGRLQWGFTGYTMSGQQDGIPFRVYEHSYRSSTTRGTTHSANGAWWQYEDGQLPEFNVSVRWRGDFAMSYLAFFRRRLWAHSRARMKEIDFGNDAAFSGRFVVHGAAEAPVRRLLTPQLRQVLLDTVHAGTVGGKATVLAWDRPGRLWGMRALAVLRTDSDRLLRAFTGPASGSAADR